jgi:hypothetical protein
MDENDRIEYLERRLAFLESTLAKFMAVVLHPERKHKGKTKAKDQAGAVGGRLVLERGLNAALIDLLERVDLTQTEQMAMPDPKVLRRLGSE